MFRIYSRFDTGSFCEWHECQGCDSLLAGDYESARFWLSGFLVDDEQESNLRIIAHRCGDGLGLGRRRGQDLVEELARMVGNGQLRVCQQQSRLMHGEGTIAEAAAPVASPPPPPVARSQSAPVAAAPPEPATMSNSVDAAAMAAVLQSAADDGVPFCEVCEQERKEREQAAAEVPA